jgi:hypothetical protein
MPFYPKDYDFGIQQEIKILPILREKFGQTIVPKEDRFSRYDYYNEQAIFELKSRTNAKNKYPTTLLTCNKVVEGIDKDKYFLFNFTDQLCFIKYDSELFSTFEKKPFSRNFRKEDEKDYFYIPINFLETIKVF